MKISIIALALSCLSMQAAASQTGRSDPETGASTWEIFADGVAFSLTQILPDQVRAFYVNRGFTLEQIDPYAVSCVYMTVLRNDNAPGIIRYVSSDWRITFEDKRHDLVPVGQWVDRLADSGAPIPALIAFRWAQFPPEQEYRPGGDWNQGMLSIGLPAGSRFEIAAHWDIEGKTYEAELTGVQCAE